jgi:HD superfamily phosphodiesterase
VKVGYSTDILIERMKAYFGGDERRIEHALSVLAAARAVNAVEKADPVVVEAAAVLHDIGIHEAERKYGSSAGNYQEIEGPPIAKEILAEFDLDEDVVEHVLAIIAEHHSAKTIDTREFRVLWDADWLVNIPDEFDLEEKTSLGALVVKVFKTAAGREMAEKKFL